LLLAPTLFLAALCAGCGQGNALSRRVYWTDVLNHKIQRADVNCLRGPAANACIETVLDTLSVVPAETGHPGAKSPNSVVVDSDGGWIYWSEFWTGIHRTTLDGLSTQTTVPTRRMPIHDSWFPPVYLPGLDRDTPELLRADIQGIDIDPVRIFAGSRQPPGRARADVRLAERERPRHHQVRWLGFRQQAVAVDAVSACRRGGAAVGQAGETRG